MTTPVRPTSPHLQIYRRSYTMVLSILHRATGLALSVGLLLLAVWLLALASGPGAYARVTALLDSWLGLAVLAGFAGSFCYHFVTGIRHLGFDTGHWLERREARRSAVVVVLATLVLALLVLWMALRLRGLA
jgi:succinate dehydrogenase / fumarate reductase, cytochrome b subunit